MCNVEIKKKWSSDNFIGMMGSTEMECALAVMLNKAHEKGCLFPDVVVCEKDFDPQDYDRDGFHEMIGHKWIEPYPDVPALDIFDHYKPCADLVRRVHKRYPNV